MTAVLLDAYGAVALLRGEAAAPDIVEMLRAGDPVRIHPLNLAEVLDRMARLDGVDPDDVEADIVLAGIVVAEPDTDALIDAGRLRAGHYHHLAGHVRPATSRPWWSPRAARSCRCPTRRGGGPTRDGA